MPPQLARLVANPPCGVGWVHEIKFDGYRMQAHLARGWTRWYSRSGLDWSDQLADLGDQLAHKVEAVLDGELCVARQDGTADFSALRSEMGRRQRGLGPSPTSPLAFFVFDILSANGMDLRPRPLAERKQMLETEVEPKQWIRLVPPLPGEGPALLSAACALKLEGIVSKRLDSAYEGGDRRPDTWRKSKCRPTVDVVVGGWRSKGSRFIGLLVGEPHASGGLRYVGTVGTGFGSADLADLIPLVEALKTGSSPFLPEAFPRSSSEVTWVRPQLVVEVAIAEWTPSGRLRQASFKAVKERSP